MESSESAVDDTVGFGEACGPRLAWPVTVSPNTSICVASAGRVRSIGTESATTERVGCAEGPVGFVGATTGVDCAHPARKKANPKEIHAVCGIDFPLCLNTRKYLTCATAFKNGAKTDCKSLTPPAILW